MLDDLGVDLHLGQAVGVEDDVVGAEQDRLERDRGAGVVGQPLDEQGLALLDAVLLAAGLDDRVHVLYSVRGCFRLGSGTAPSASAATAPRLGFYGILAGGRLFVGPCVLVGARLGR